MNNFRKINLRLNLVSILKLGLVLTSHFQLKSLHPINSKIPSNIQQASLIVITALNLVYDLTDLTVFVRVIAYKTVKTVIGAVRCIEACLS